MKIVNKTVSRDKLGQRVTSYAVEGVPRNPRTVYAVCVESDDPKYLTISKLYRVKFTGDYVALTDDQGEAAVYPATFFVQVDLPKETRSRIESAMSV